MHIVLRVRGAVVVAVRRAPVDGVALHGQGAAVRKEVLQDLERLEGAVGELTVVGQRDAEHAGDEVAHEEAGEGLPREVEGREGSANMDDAEDSRVHEVLREPLAAEVRLRVRLVVLAGSEGSPTGRSEYGSFVGSCLGLPQASSSIFPGA